MAFACPHIATHLVSEDDRFEIYAPAVMNSEALVYKGDIASLGHLGISQGRGNIKSIVATNYPYIEQISEISSKAIQYSLVSSQIDCAVSDITKAALFDGYEFAAISDRDYISYVLIIRKDIIGTDAFNNFLARYNSFVKESSDDLALKLELPSEIIDKIRLTLLQI